MDELQRLAYLEAMEIPGFVSRRDLPGAAPSRRVRLVRRAEPAAPAPQAAGLAAGLKPVAQRKAAQPPVARPAAAVPATETEVPVFSVMAVAAGGWFWIDEIPAGREPGEDYGQLILAICRALGLEESGGQVERFSYPVNARLAGGVDEAREALLGFLSGRLSRTSPQGVVLLGEFAEPWFDRSCLEGQRVVETVSAWRMLREPALKAQAWSDLQPLRGDGG